MASNKNTKTLEKPKINRTIELSNNFKKQIKKVSSYKGFNSDKLKNAVELLATGHNLDVSYKNHAMVKTSPQKYQGLYDFHISPNIVVVYGMSDSTITLMYIGSHQDLGLTEELEN